MSDSIAFKGSNFYIFISDRFVSKFNIVNPSVSFGLYNHKEEPCFTNSGQYHPIGKK